ncbi:MAG: hypothetical protein QF632_02940, partial [Candidatus Woesearchaeota archaeon]|nr:hypothetical protein [Candidatus Woesearchaeota archaeon]
DASFRFEEIHNEKGNMSPVGGNYRVIVNSDAEELVYNVQIGRKGTRKWKYSISGPNFTSEGLRVNYTFSPWIHYRRSHASRFMEAADIERRGLRVLSGLQEVVRHDSAGVVMHTGGDTYFFMASAPLFSRGRIADEAVPVKERSKGLGSIPGRMLDFSREVHDWSIYGEFPALRRLMGPDGKCPSFRHLLYNTHGINQGSNLTTRAVHSTALKLLGSGFIYAYASVVVLRLLSTFGYTVYNRRARDHISAHDPKEKWDTLISNHLEVHWPLYQRGDVRSWVDFEQSLQNLFVKVSKKNGSSIQELAEKYLQIKSSIHEILEMAEGDLPSQYQSIRRLITDADIIGKTIPPELDNLLIKLRPLEFDSLTNHHLEWCEHLRDRGLLSNEYANKKDLDTVFQEWGEIYYQRLLGFETPTNVGPVRSPTMASKCLDDVLASFRGKVREESDEELDLMAGAALKKLDNANSLSIAGTVISYLPLVNFLGVTFDLGMYVAWTLLSNVHGGISGPYTNQASNRMAFHVYVSRKMATEAEHTMKAGVFQRAQNLWYLLGDSLVAGSVFLDQLVLKPLYGENAVQTFYPYFGLFGLGLASTVAGFAYYFKFHKQFKEDFGWEHEGLIDKVKKLGKKWGGRLSRRFRKEE